MRSTPTWSGARPARRTSSSRASSPKAVRKKYPGQDARLQLLAVLQLEAQPRRRHHRASSSASSARWATSSSSSRSPASTRSTTRCSSSRYGYARDDMTAFVELQQKEFAAAEQGFTAVKHQREVGTGYFDQITQVVTGGRRRPPRCTARPRTSSSSTRRRRSWPRPEVEAAERGGKPRRTARQPSARDRAHHPRRASTGTTASSAQAAVEAKALFERAAWAEMRALARERIQMYDQRVAGGGARRCVARFPEAERDEALWPRDQARVHRAAVRAPAARVRRDLLQLGRLPGAAPALLPQRVHLLAPGDLHRAPRGRGADLPLLLPAAGRAAQDAARDRARASG